MSGSIGIVASETGRYTLFSASLMRIKHPPNTTPDWGMSSDISGARNMLVERSLERGSEWILFLDDDHVYPDDILLRLLAHEKDITCSLYMQRQPPFGPVAYTHRVEGSYMPLQLPGMPEEGLIDIYATGCSGMLIRSEVFRAIEYPWFEHGRVGELWNASEDLIFCEKAREAGFDIHLDLGVRLGHLAPCAIWPSWIDEEWVVGFSVANNTSLFVPIEKQAEAPAPADAVRR